MKIKAAKNEGMYLLEKNAMHTKRGNIKLAKIKLKDETRLREACEGL